MKLFAFALILFSINAFSQTSLSEGRRAFICSGISSNLNSSHAASVELGYWGMKKATSYAFTFDVDNFGSTYLGFKPYFTIFDDTKVSYMLYFQPKIQLDNMKNKIIEFGFNPNYTLNENFLLAATLGNQVTSVQPFNFFMGIGIIYLRP